VTGRVRLSLLDSMTTHRNDNTRRSIARTFGVALFSTVVFTSLTAGAAFAGDHSGPGDLAVAPTTTEPQPDPQPQPQPEVDDKDGPVKCTVFNPDLLEWALEPNEAGTQVTVTASYADDYDTCSQDLQVATYSLPDADADFDDAGSVDIDAWEPNINDIEAAGSLSVPLNLLGCFNEVVVYLDDTAQSLGKLIDVCPADDQPYNGSGAGQPGGPGLPETGTGSTLLATIGGMMLAIGVGLRTVGARRRNAAI
jgi:LPXTG-motif cell wall-anchored protein